MIEIDIRQRLGTFDLEIALTAPGGVTALFGRSGAGKTALLNVISGLALPDRGRVAINGAVLVDTQRRIFVPMHRRRIGYVFQDSRLFPHLTVRQNLLYGRWFALAGPGEPALERVAGMLGLERLLERRPRYLSGGERQRVAIGRALLASPRVLLLDEPLASLDEARKAEIMPYLDRLAQDAEVPIIYVTHAISEVARLASTLVVVAGGRVLAAGPLGEVMQRLDMFRHLGRAEAGVVINSVVESHDTATGITSVQSRAGRWFLPKLNAASGASFRFRVRARDVMLAIEQPRGISALNVFPGIIVEIGWSGPVADIRLDCNGESIIARLTRLSVDRLRLAPGSAVFAIIKSVAFDRRAGMASAQIAAADGSLEGR